MKAFFEKFLFKKGEWRWTPFLAWFVALTAIGVAFLYPEIIDSFATRFFRSGIFQILGPVAGVATLIYLKKAVAKDKFVTAKTNSAWKVAALGVLLFWAGLFGPNVGFKEDKKASIPKVSVYYGNGKVRNATDSTKSDYYFNEFTVHPGDSAYIVRYGEEPGYNLNWRSFIGEDTTLKSKAPRADEFWQRPLTNDALEFENGTRSK